jgi:hypothetical protein
MQAKTAGVFDRESARPCRDTAGATPVRYLNRHWAQSKAGGVDYSIRRNSRLNRLIMRFSRREMYDWLMPKESATSF